MFLGVEKVFIEKKWVNPFQANVLVYFNAWFQAGVENMEGRVGLFKT